MGKVIELREAINLIWETVKITEDQSTGAECPYIFIVGAGISVPEILPASGIIQHCQEKIKELYKGNEEELKSIFDKAQIMLTNSAEYYSYWFGQAYKNKIHRQQYLKSIISKARISTSNLLLAQVLHSKKIATTVITPNFDNQLLRSLSLLGNYDVFSADNVLDNVALTRNSQEIQIMHVHGTYQFYDCCNLSNEIAKIANEQGVKSTAGTIGEFLNNQSPIVIGYSGWEDDVIMSKLKERLQYTVLPYGLIWFCYSKKDYEDLPNWLKEADDVFCVVPDIKEDAENVSDKDTEPSYLPAEDVLNALITRFEFSAPTLFSNPIQYYIELIDGFLPENVDVFPIKSWKRRLDFIEEHLDDIQKQIIVLESAAARKDVIDITRTLQQMDYSFIPVDDLEHVINGIILPLLNSKNRIEDEKDLLEFLDEILELLIKRHGDIEEGRLRTYIEKIVGFVENYDIKNSEGEARATLYNRILEVCKFYKSYEEIELVVLGMKSDAAETENQRIELQNQIIERGMDNIDNAGIARVVLIAILKQIESQKSMTAQKKALMEQVVKKHSRNKKILKLYYEALIRFCEDGISNDIGIQEIINQIVQNDLQRELLLHAKVVQSKSERAVESRVRVACEAIDNYDYDSIESCKACLNYVLLLNIIIINKININQPVNRKYIDCMIRVSDKEEQCRLIAKIIVDSLEAYIENIESQYEKKELCEKAIDICSKNKLYKEWCFVCDTYIDLFEKKDKDVYLLENDRYRVFCETREKMSAAIDLYVAHDISTCGEIMCACSETYEKIFEGKYNPALINVCFMMRRNELPQSDISVLNMLDKITWMNSDAFFHINKALVHILQGDWINARKQVASIKTDLPSALQWWSQEEVVGKKEKYVVLLLLALEKKLSKDEVVLKTEEFWDFCMGNLMIPDNIKEEISGISEKYLLEC